MQNRYFHILFISLIHCSLFAGEGMWLPQLLKALNEGDMQTMGMKLNAEDIYSVNHSSLKDAIVHFGGFCTGEIISNNGLILTNHHCGYDNIQSHSSLEKNYLKDGFWAKNYSDELPNPGLYVRFIEKIEDFTDKALQGVNTNATVSERQSAIDKNIEAFVSNLKTDEFHEVFVRPFFDGNKYYIFYTVRYNDVRLVGTPPESIGKFGADTDNWVWPRHTGDFSLFRVYAGPDNQPANYAAENKPFTPKHFLPISLDGIDEGDFTMVFGFPGRTSEYLPSQAVINLLETQNPGKIAIRDAALKIQEKYMRADPGIKIKYSSKFASTANYWKKWIGESLGLQKTNGVEKKQKFEKEFIERAKKAKQYEDLVPTLNKLHQDIQPYAKALEYYRESALRNIELIRIMSTYRRLVRVYQNNDQEAFKKQVATALPGLEDFYKDYVHKIDLEVAVAVLTIYANDLSSEFIPKGLTKNNAKELADQWYTSTKLGSFDDIKGILQMAPADAIAKLSADPIYQFAEEWENTYNASVTPSYSKFSARIDSLQRVYMAAQMALFPGKKFYPDANSTLRVTYGQVEGFTPKDGIIYAPSTYLSGVIEKYVPGDYEFDLPQKLIELHETKNFGPYKDETGDVPVCFLGSNHTTGGNSGSPAIDAYGNLVGLNFDRVWEGTMSDINYDRSICRNIMVDARFVLFIIDKFAGAQRIIDEIKVVHPKKEQKAFDKALKKKHKAQQKAMKKDLKSAA
ncbi:MAG: S46 family peptidase [Saprospiraceae bacterium]|nr:S46 family peptidase [Saprospiraceae bacterium]